MENALLVGLSRQMALQREMDVIANNIANVNTNGFKADTTIFEQYLMPVARDDHFPRPDRRINFVQDRATWNDFRQGAVQPTGNPLDVAINGPGFLVIETPRGERYTRNGALQLNARNELVTSEGFRVLGDNGPIVFQPRDGEIMIARDGTVSVPQGARGKVRVVAFADQQQLEKDGNSTYSAPAGVAPQVADRNTRLINGAIEKSNVSAVTEMTRMLQVTRTYQAIAGLMQAQSDLRRTAIQQLAEVPL